MAIVKFQASLLTALRAANNRLEYLTQNDWLLIADKAEPIQFKNGGKRFNEGKQTKAVYLLIKGTVGIQTGTETEIAQVGPGEICGEMATWKLPMRARQLLQKKTSRRWQSVGQSWMTYLRFIPILHPGFIVPLRSRYLGDFVGKTRQPRIEAISCPRESSRLQPAD